MLTGLTEQPQDKILMLMTMFREDPRAEKIDLGVGVYKNAEGVTPVMGAIKAAERRLVEEQTTKSYTGLAGDPAFNAAMADLVLGGDRPTERMAGIATPGGTGAVRQAFELIKMANPEATVWYSDPTWPNHLSILDYLGIPRRAYRYFDTATRAVDVAGMMADLAQVKAGDVVLLHGCCHNPTGANLTLAEWQDLVLLLEKTGALPMVDIAYQGFGDGLEEDAAGLRQLVSRLPQALIAASCSKNFGVYRERTGALMAVAPDAGAAKLTQGTLAFLNRQNYSFPPDHGARAVTTVLQDAGLRAEWEAELDGMRTSMLELRKTLAGELRQRSNSDKFDFLEFHRGMFSRLGATPEQVTAMRENHGVYMVGDSRMNIAGLKPSNIPALAEAIISAGV